MGPVDPCSYWNMNNFAAWADYDNDGFLDLWVSGYTSGNKLFRNNGDSSFTQVTTEAVTNEPAPNGAGTYQVAWFDYNNDGALDLYLMNGDDLGAIWTANQLFRNNGNGNAWLTVRPIGTGSNRDGVGAKVRALATYADEARWQRRDISGGGLGNGNHRYAHFRPRRRHRVDVLRIEWPSGIVQELKDVAANLILTVTEPPPDPQSASAASRSSAGSTRVLTSSAHPTWQPGPPWAPSPTRPARWSSRM
jgi:hypothetical protein